MSWTLKQICNNTNTKTKYYWTIKVDLFTFKYTSRWSCITFFSNWAESVTETEKGGGGGLRKRGENRIKRVSWLAHTLLENKAGAVTTPILCSWGRQSVMMMKQLMIHALLSEVVKGALAHTPWKTACDCTIVAGIDSHLVHQVARPVAFSHDNRDTRRCCF